MTRVLAPSFSAPAPRPFELRYRSPNPSLSNQPFDTSGRTEIVPLTGDLT